MIKYSVTVREVIRVDRDEIEFDCGTVIANPLRMAVHVDEMNRIIHELSVAYELKGHPEKIMTMGETAKFMNVSIDTLRNLDKRGTLVPIRTEGGHRRYKQSNLDEYIQKRKDAKSMKKIKK